MIGLSLRFDLYEAEHVVTCSSGRRMSLIPCLRSHRQYSESQRARSGEEVCLARNEDSVQPKKMVEASKLATLAFILVPIVIKRAIPWWNKRQARGKKGGATKGLPIPTGNLALPQFAQASPASPFIPYLRYLVAAAFLSYFFYRGYVDQSINLFAQFKLPLSTPTTQVEQLAKQLYGEPLSADMMLLLTRLRSATTRSIYMKVGPEPLGQCTFCNVSQEHFLLYLIPGKLVEYMIAAASVGLLTSQKERMEWRAWVVLPLIVMVIAEAFVLLQDWPKDLAVRPSSFAAKASSENVH